MRAIYSFWDRDGFVIGNLHEMDLAACPHAGEIVTFAADGQSGERTFVVDQVRHVIHKNLEGEITQVIDITVSPPQ